MLGGIVGAGFLSGKEIVVYFSGGLVPIAIASIVFFVVLFVVFYGGERVKENTFFKVLLSTCNFIFLVGMASGLNALEESLFGKCYYLFLTMALIVSHFLSLKGIDGIKILSLILMPVSLIIVNVLLFSSEQSLCLNVVTPTKSSIVNAVLYVFINVFPLSPFLKKTAERKRIKDLIFPTVFFCVFFFVQANFILGKVGTKGNFSLPILLLVDMGGLSFFVHLALILGTLTSLISFYYPLHDSAKKGGGFCEIILPLMTFFLSLCGLDFAVKYLYPLIGVCGIIYVFSIALACMNKKTRNRNNSNKEEKICPRKKRTK